VLGLGRHVVVQHLAVLRESGLVLVEKRGRQRLNHLNAVPIQRIHERWVSQYAQPWIAALVGLDPRVDPRDGCAPPGRTRAANVAEPPR